jgi:peptide/nickel transport system substrate-binding protein
VAPEMKLRARLLTFLLLTTVGQACAPAGQVPQSQQVPSERGASAGPTTPKRIIAAMMGDAHTVYNKLNLGNGVPGIDTLEELVSSGLANVDVQGNLRPQLAEAVPSLDNGLWKVSSDGSMELIYRIRPGARWHDGTPFTTDDLVFSAKVMQDRELAALRDANFVFLEGVHAVDPTTLVVRWREPFINADQLFSRRMTLPLPKHLLEKPFAEDKTNFLNLPYWAQEFVGTGPFKIREYERGNHLILEANDGYVLGRPKIDQVEVKFILDANTLAANILAGEVDLTIGRTLSLDQALEVRDQWRDGKVDLAPSFLYRIWPQLVNPTPSVIGDVQFRQAVLYALDRQQMVDTFQFGLAAVAETFLPPNRPEYADIERGIPRYPYDARRAMQLIEGLGYSHGPDGIYRDAAGTRLSVEIRSSGGDPAQENSLILSTADYWQRVGVGTDVLFIPAQRNQDREYRATRPGFVLRAGPSDLAGLQSLTSAQVPRQETNFAGTNDTRYANPEFDALWNRYLTTIPLGERMQVARQLVNHVAEQVIVLPIFYRMEPTAVSNRLKGATARQLLSTQAWNAELWDV